MRFYLYIYYLYKSGKGDSENCRQILFILFFPFSRFLFSPQLFAWILVCSDSFRESTSTSRFSQLKILLFLLPNSEQHNPRSIYKLGWKLNVSSVCHFCKNITFIYSIYSSRKRLKVLVCSPKNELYYSSCRLHNGIIVRRQIDGFSNVTRKSLRNI